MGVSFSWWVSVDGAWRGAGSFVLVALQLVRYLRDLTVCYPGDRGGGGELADWGCTAGTAGRCQGESLRG